MQPHDTFTGSYQPGDVEFLLKPVVIEMTPVEQKEELIQSGKKHYSDMLSQEPAPTQWHLDLFHRALDRGAERLAKKKSHSSLLLWPNALVMSPLYWPVLSGLACRSALCCTRPLRDMGKTSWHYGISIIRDRGIDGAALDVIEERHGTSGIVFVDGWTGKGAITGELVRALKDRPGYPEQPRLVVPPIPVAAPRLAASDDDWLIPFGIMGAPVSGLISRSVWSSEGLHGCMVCEHLSEFECSRMLVDTVAHFRKKLTPSSLAPLSWNTESARILWQTSRDVIAFPPMNLKWTASIV